MAEEASVAVSLTDPPAVPAAVSAVTAGSASAPAVELLVGVGPEEAGAPRVVLVMVVRGGRV